MMWNQIKFFGMLIFACNCIGVVSPDSSAKHHMCSKMCDLFLGDETSTIEEGHHEMTRGKPGKRGIPGERGVKGAPGSPGVVDYGRIYEVLEDKITAETTKMSENIDSRLNQFGRSLELIKASINSLEKSAVKCDGVPFDGKCFIAEIRDQRKVTPPDAVEMCNQHGGKLANIYSEDHYDLIYEYVRNKMVGTWTGLWLGMSYDTNAQNALLSNGGVPQYTTWYAGYPSKSSSHIYMGLVVKRIEETTAKGMHNYPSTQTRFGALCEY